MGENETLCDDGIIATLITVFSQILLDSVQLLARHIAIVLRSRIAQTVQLLVSGQHLALHDHL